MAETALDLAKTAFGFYCVTMYSDVYREAHPEKFTARRALAKIPADATERIAELEKQLAAMRETLEKALQDIPGYGSLDWDAPLPDWAGEADAILATEVGKPDADRRKPT